MKKWTEEEINYLIKYYPDNGPDIPQLNQRARKSIIEKARTLGIKKLSFYNYSNKLPTDIICLEKYINQLTPILHQHTCGHVWKVRPKTILSDKTSCPACVRYMSKTVYLIYFPDLLLYKVGVTSNILRRKKDFGYNCIILNTQTYSNSKEALKKEKELLNSVQLINTGNLRCGNTETFSMTSEAIEEFWRNN